MIHLIHNQLVGPWPDEAVEVHNPGPDQYKTVKASALRQRLNNILGNQWREDANEPQVTEFMVSCRVTVSFMGQSRTATGAMPIENGRIDLAIKGAETNGFVRACQKFGMEVQYGEASSEGRDTSTFEKAMQAMDRMHKPYPVAGKEDLEGKDEEEVEYRTLAKQDKNVGYVFTKADDEAVEQFLEKYKGNVAELRRNLTKWDLVLIKELFGGLYSAAEIKAVMRFLEFEGIEEYLESTSRFTRQQALRWYNKYCGKKDDWAEDVINGRIEYNPDASFVDGILENSKSVSEDEMQPEEEQPEDNSIEQPIEQKESLIEHSIKQEKEVVQRKPDPVKEEPKASNDNVSKFAEILGMPREPRSDGDAIEVMDIIEESKIGVDEVNYADVVNKQILEVYPDYDDFVKNAPHALIPFLCFE